MEHSKERIAKIGIVSFLNAAPIYETWKNTVVEKNWQLVEGSPSLLDKQLAEGQLDLGLVSSYEYGLHPDRYKILSGLSISAVSAIGSVFLFSHVPFNQLDKAEVLLSFQSETSINLTKIILEEFNGVTPVYTTGDISSIGESDFKAVLAIGDDALRMVAESGYLYQFDLADIWRRETGLPFVFAICCVREDFCQQNPEMVNQIHKELLRCRNEGIDTLKEICDIAAPRIPMPVTSCCKYLQSMEYNFDELKQKSLTTYYDFLVKRDEIEKFAFPLKIYSNII